MEFAWEGEPYSVSGFQIEYGFEVRQVTQPRNSLQSGPAKRKSRWSARAGSAPAASQRSVSATARAARAGMRGRITPRASDVRAHPGPRSPRRLDARVTV